MMNVIGILIVALIVDFSIGNCAAWAILNVLLAALGAAK